MMGARFADVFRHTAFEHHVSHRLDDTEAVDAACHPDRQAFPSEPPAPQTSSPQMLHLDRSASMQ